jgi:UDP-N-acetylmuramoylalanine--D-glutamate ligase
MVVRGEDGELTGKGVLVVGLARSGVAAAEFLVARGARVVATDLKPRETFGPEVLALERKGVRFELGGHRADSFTSAELIVLSPGVPWDRPELAAARASGVPMWSELELAWRFLQGEVAAVTGTKGKSTTTAALGAMLGAAGREVRVGGNIGRPAITLADGSTNQTHFVLVVSSFQLETTQTLRPHVAIFLNLSDDHLDRHASFEEYAAAKARIFRNQEAGDWAVVNADDERVLALARAGRARLVTFAEARRGDGAFFDGPEARLSLDGRLETLFDRRTVRLPGSHLALDLLAAATAARLLGTPTEAIARAAAAFDGAEHVLEHVADIRGVRFFNDSKATNVDAASKSIQAFDQPVIAILGGRYKGGDFARLRAAGQARLKLVLAIGEAQAIIARALDGAVGVRACQTLREAVERAFAAAAPGDVVLLAPGCSSFDMFEDYAQRGRAFKYEVQRLKRGRGALEAGV